MKKAFLVVGTACFVFLCAFRASAAQNDSPAPKPAPEGKTYFSAEGSGPAIGDIPFVKDMAKYGATFRYMGSRSGLDGFLIVRNGRVQMMYVTADKKSVLLGGLFADDGQLVTPLQISELSRKDQEVKAIMDGASVQNIDLLRANVQKGGMAEIPGGKAQAVEDASGFPLMDVSPGERLVADLKASSGVILGKASAPELLMVVSPNCGHCKGTWKEIRDFVKDGKLQIRLIPIGLNPQSDEFRVGAVLLRAKQPFEAWDAYVSGKKEALAGEPDQAALRAVYANREMMDRWNIMGTPYLVYRDAKNTIKIVQGKPERMAAVLADLIRQ